MPVYIEEEQSNISINKIGIKKIDCLPTTNLY
jgi:hypothetical protein